MAVALVDESADFIRQPGDIILRVDIPARGVDFYVIVDRLGPAAMRG